MGCDLLHVVFRLSFSFHLFICVGCMDHSDSESDFELHADVCVTGADGAGAKSSAAVAHASASVGNVKKQTTVDSFFK